MKYEVEINHVCSVCGDDLESEEDYARYQGNVIKVEPCERCMGEEYKRGINDAEEEE